MTSVFRIVKLLLLLGVLCLAGGWAILAMPLFSDLRRPFLEDLLSEQIGQPLYIKEDVRITLGATSHIHAGTVQIPSETIPELILAELNVFELDLNLLALMKGKVDIDNLVVDGLNVRMSTQEDGTQSWATENGQELELPSFGRSKEDAELQATDRDGILEFLSDKTASFTSVRWIVDNRVTGFKFDFDLNDARLEQIGDAGGITATSKGSVNGQDFTIKGNYPKGEAFTTATTFGDVKLDFDGMPIDEQQGGGFTGKLSLNTGEIGDFLEVLRLDRDFEGQAELAADLHHQKGQLKATNIKTDIDLSSGSKITANGKIDNLLTATGIDLDFIGRLYPEGKPPSPTNDLKDLRLADLSTQLVSTEGALEFQDLILTTNAFDENFSRLGPVNIGKVFRGDEGNLMFENISLQAGPQDAPFITAEGNIKDLLRLKDIDFDGTFSVPASAALKGLGGKGIETLGGIDGKFAINDLEGFLNLNYLDAHSVDTDIWEMTTQAKLGNVTEFEHLDFDLSLNVVKSARFLEALNLKKVGTGPLKIRMSSRGKTENFTSTLGVTARQSQIDTKLDTTIAGERAKTTGKIASESVAIKDVEYAIAVGSQLAKIGQKKRSDKANTSKPKANVTQFLELEDFLLEQDVEIAIDIKKIVGTKAVTSLSSQLTATNGLAKLGPVEVAYDGAHFAGSAEMDMIKSPKLLSVNGRGRGWNLNDVLKTIGLHYAAEGQLHGKFTFTGQRRSINAFVNSMQGSATILMSNGGIATSLIELAGLGVFPWLFSEELRKGYSKITCLSAPLKIDAGDVTFDSFAAETTKVQLVARGSLDWKKNSISVHAEARKLNKALSRSAWPFDVTGTLTKPKIKLLVGGRFQKRADGAKKLPDRRKACLPDIDQLR